MQLPVYLSAGYSNPVLSAGIFDASSDKKINGVLIVVALLFIGAASLAYYNQLKTAKLYKLISRQKARLEELVNIKDKIFSVVSHDMRAPINTLIAFIQLLEYDDIPPEKLAAYTTALKKSLTHTSVLMENLLNWAKSQMAGFKPVIEIFDLEFTAKDVLNTLQTQADAKEITIRNTIASGTLILADTNMTHLVLRNLISNSIKYTHNKGAITIAAIKKNSKVIITVSDSGIGMPERLVEEFNADNYLHFTESTPGTNKEKGTGLGLVLCKNFVLLMNGSIIVKSKIEKGSQFSIQLPAA